MSRYEKPYPHKSPFLSVAERDGRLVLRIRQATIQGYAECVGGGVFDASYASSLYRRARVKDDGRTSSTITGNEVLWVFQEIKET